MELEQKLPSLPSASSVSSSPGLPKSPHLFQLSGHRNPITKIALHPVFSQLATASEDATIKIWDSETGEFEKTLKGHTKTVLSIEYDSKGTLLASCSADLSIKIWDSTQSYSNTKTLLGHDHSISSISFTPTNTHLISSSRDVSIRIWDLSSGYCTRTISGGHTDWIRAAVSFSNSSGEFIVSCSNDQSLRVWGMDGECKSVLSDHEHVVECVVVLDSESGKFVREFVGETGTEEVVESGRYLCSGSRDKTIKIWDSVTAQCVATLVGHDSWVRGLCTTPSKQHLISVSDDKSIKIWDLKTCRLVKSIPDAHDHFITCVAAKGRFVATGSVDMSVKLWG
ncbi:Platelet-activating factor acetylhydrolase IB subunit alpha [Nowakowskiella sp. JEL0407]|nr:Platelet-activating factor acetylhydrolase IB subunit alpha [Nowakowskiella sp. JEL0407]